MNKPDIHSFLDFREYLKALWSWKKASSKDFSYAAFANRAGFQAKSFLPLVISGKRNLTPDGATKMALGFGLSRGEADTFTHLVQFNQAKDYTTRTIYWEKIVKDRAKKTGRHQILDQYKFLARLSYPVLLVCLRQPHVDHSDENLKRLLGFSDSELREALETLKSLNAITELAPGRYTVMSSGFHTGDDIPTLAAQNFHRNMLNLAATKLELPTPEREFQSLMIPLNIEQRDYIKTRIRSLIDEIDEKCGGVSPKSERVYALNINLVPITGEFTLKGEGK